MKAVYPGPQQRYAARLDTREDWIPGLHAAQEGMFVRKTVARLRAITRAALMTIQGKLDDISGFGQTSVAHQLCKSIPITWCERYRVPPVEHYNIFGGKWWRELIHPRVREFIGKRQ